MAIFHQLQELDAMMLYDHDDVHFEDISRYRKSQAWKHFLYDRNLKIAKCNLCGKILKSHGSTKTLQRHMKTHEIHE